MVTGCSCGGTVRAQGVMHVWPWVVRISAPGGSDSKFNAWSCSDEEVDDSAAEQPVSDPPATAATATASATRDMTLLPPLFCSATQPSRAVTLFSQAEIGCSCALRLRGAAKAGHSVLTKGRQDGGVGGALRRRVKKLLPVGNDRTAMEVTNVAIGCPVDCEPT